MIYIAVVNIALSFVCAPSLQWTGYAGLYLQNETGGMIVGRVPNTILANNSVVIFGAVSRVQVASLENGTISNELFLTPRFFAADECFGNNQSNSQPGLFTVVFTNENRTGQERIYFVDNADCSDGRISNTFLFICKFMNIV